MDCQSQGILILEKVAWKSDKCIACSRTSNHCATIQKPCDSRNIVCQKESSYGIGHRARKESIFDIFWEKFNAPPMHACQAGRHLGSHLVARNDHHLFGNHFENIKQPWGMPIGCYNVYM